MKEHYRKKVAQDLRNLQNCTSNQKLRSSHIKLPSLRAICQSFKNKQTNQKLVSLQRKDKYLTFFDNGFKKWKKRFFANYKTFFSYFKVWIKAELNRIVFFCVMLPWNSPGSHFGRKMFWTSFFCTILFNFKS